MADLEASIDFSIELGTFYNIDLFQRGYYQIRVGLKSFSSRTPLIVKCKNPKSGNLTAVKPARMTQGVSVSQTFQVLYKNEDLLLNDVFSFTVQMLLDSNKLEECIEKSGLKLIVELWFVEELSDIEDNLEVACSRVYDINFSPTLGLHMHIPVIFDYFHLCAVCTTIHASLISLHQPIYSPKNPATSWPLRGGRMSTLDSVLYNAQVPVHAFVHIQKSSLRSANYMFRQICKLLLSAHESLQNEIKRIAKRVKTKKPIPEPEYRDCHSELDKLCKELEVKLVKCEEDFLLYATSKIAHLCGHNVVLWQTFLDICVNNVRVIKILAKEYHQARAKRFSEAFFSQEWAKKDVLNCFEPSVNGHSDLVAVVRGSSYFNHPPSMPLVCTEVDGNQTNLPIIFEDIYRDETAAPLILEPSRPASMWDITSLDEDSLSSQSSPSGRLKATKSNQMIKNVMPAMLARPSKVYTMTDDDYDKRESKDKNSADPQLLGFKRISNDLLDEPYELGSLSPANERSTTLRRRKSLLMPHGERRRKKISTESNDSEQTTSDNFSQPTDESPASDVSSNSTGSALSVKDVNISPQSERSYKISNGIKKAIGSPLTKKHKAKLPRPQSAMPINPDADGETLSNKMGINSPTAYQITSSQSESQLSSSNQILVQPVTDKVIDFLTRKEDLKAKLAYQGHLYSDFASIASEIPYFWPPSSRSSDLHLIICVHGLDGNYQDLRLIKQYLELALPGEKLDFMMSEVNEDTFLDFQTMAEKLADEILNYIDVYSVTPSKISFIAHSLGNIIVRTALTIPRLLDVIKPQLYTYLSLSGPHLGTVYSDSGLVNMALWVMQKWKKSGSLMQLAMKDHPDPKATFIYKLSLQPGLELFKSVLLVSSIQDKYVPYHSTRIELSRSAQRDNSTLGRSYVEMVQNILEPLLRKPELSVIRYDVFFTLPTNTNSVIGRAAHIAVLDSELFIEKFLLVCGCKYFK